MKRAGRKRKRIGHWYVDISAKNKSNQFFSSSIKEIMFELLTKNFKRPLDKELSF